jgi:hypothetical protein
MDVANTIPTPALPLKGREQSNQECVMDVANTIPTPALPLKGREQSNVAPGWNGRQLAIRPQAKALPFKGRVGWGWCCPRTRHLETAQAVTRGRW